MRRKIFVLFLTAVVLTGSVFASEIEDKSFFTARQAFSDRFYQAAITLFNRFIKEFPAGKKVYEAKLFIAESYYFKEEYPEALGALNEIILNKGAEQPVINAAYYWLGMVYSRQKRFNDSLVYVQRAIDNYSDYENKWPACYLAAVNYLELEKPEPALRWFRKIIQESGETELVNKSYLYLLDYYDHKKDYPEFISLGGKYLESHLDFIVSAKVYFYLGESRYAAGEFDAAIDNYQRALKFNQEDSFADLIYQGLSFAFLEKGDTAAALSGIDKIKDPQLRLFSQGRYYSQIKNYPQALETFNNFLEKFKDSKYFETVCLHKADTLYELERFNDAASQYQQIIRRVKGVSSVDNLDQAHYGLARCYLKKGGFREAAAEFKNTLKYTDDSVVKASSLVLIADAYLDAESCREALDIYNEILNNYPDTIYADYIRFQKGIIFFKTERMPDAIAVFKDIKEKFPSSPLIPQAQYYLAAGYFSCGRYKETKILLEDFMMNFPEDKLMAGVYYFYGKCFFAEKDYSRALEFFKKVTDDFEAAARLNGSFSFDAKLSLARIYVQRSEYKRALELYDELADGDSSAGKEAVLDKAFLFKDLKDYNQAVVFFRKAVGAGIDSSKIRFTLAFCWEKMNQPKEAVKEYFKVINGFDDEYKIKAYFRVARIYEKEGDLESAKDIYRRIADFDVQETKIAAARMKELDN